MTAKAEREARLAAQLRANLKRRKEAGRKGAAGEAAPADQRGSSDDPTDTAADAAR